MNLLYYLQVSSLEPFLSINLSSAPGVELVDAQWNCGADFPSLLASCMSDGSLSLYDIKSNLSILAKLPATAQVTCSKLSCYSYLYDLCE